MPLRLFVILLPFCWAFDASAQVPEQLSSSVPEQWQLTLDVIKSKAQALMAENNGLQNERRQLIEQLQRLQQSIEDQKNKNEQMERFLKERHGRTDQQIHIEELAQIIKAKRQQIAAFDGQLKKLYRRQADIDHRTQGLKHSIVQNQLHQQAQKPQTQAASNAAPSQDYDQLTQWRKQLEDENRQEVLFENELKSLKTGDKAQNLNADAINEQNKHKK